MGGAFSIFDSCTQRPMDPWDDESFLEDEQFDTRNKIAGRRKKMDVMGMAMDMAISDIRQIVGNRSDDEERVETDVDYLDMNQLKKRYLERKRRGSDESSMRDDVSDMSSMRGFEMNYVNHHFIF